jgi:hypothetical protein
MSFCSTDVFKAAQYIWSFSHLGIWSLDFGDWSVEITKCNDRNAGSGTAAVPGTPIVIAQGATRIGHGVPLTIGAERLRALGSGLRVEDRASALKMIQSPQP